MNDNEKWLPIKGYEIYYEVSNMGRVRSKTRTISDNRCTRIFHEHMLTPTKHNGKQPYYYVSLSKNGKIAKQFVHRLVAEAFIENPLHKEQVNHKNGNVLDNRVDNLEWVTNSENTQHAYDTFLNSKNQLRIEYNGEIHSLRKWCSILGLNYDTVWNRLKILHWNINDAFERR